MWHPRPVTVLHKSHIYWQWGSCQSDTQGQFTAPETYWHPPLCVCVCRCACVKLGCDFESQFDRERWRCNHSLDVSWREKWDQGRNGSKDIFRIKLFSFLYKTKRKKKTDLGLKVLFKFSHTGVWYCNTFLTIAFYRETASYIIRSI